VFVRVITELETCYIYEVVLWTIKVAVRNLLKTSNFIAQYNKKWMYGYYSMKEPEPV
jgi:hypothetical protein